MHGRTLSGERTAAAVQRGERVQRRRDLTGRLMGERSRLDPARQPREQVPAARTADATTLLTTQRQLAAACGVALAATLAAGGFRTGLLAMAGLGGCAALLALRVSDRRVRDGYRADAGQASVRPRKFPGRRVT
ncbi:hypothetical protein ACFZDK_40580 [Streptomyces sp. NPDC007901]|uniref:hypothetical protein n=1 Tax=Streptomyces sp. NPDC007901 TaxID=3364785 RepID=UPI0036EAB0C6